MDPYRTRKVTDMNTAAQTVKPPVPYTDAAIKAGIAHEAANGPSHVRIKALGMMARITGLFELGKQVAKQLAQQAAEAVGHGKEAAADQITRKLNQYMEEAGVTSLSDFSPLATKSKSEQDEDDEEAARKDDDDVP